MTTTKVHDPELEISAVLTEELREWLMAELRYPVLAIVDADGAPTQSVMWFDLDPDRPDTILMNTKTNRAKYRWLKREPRVSLLFEDRLTWVGLQGRTELDEDSERAMADIKALARRYDS
ncbi:MAG TPA: pyridoxamine 5'-phosphate oxidase family protein, partial [Candidatus Limnocylindria bacterium]|nr:pyridoxamine 5'-phosphate oxidase family protein [Candidatus Limnocylindria bacterium]